MKDYIKKSLDIIKLIKNYAYELKFKKNIIKSLIRNIFLS